LGIGLVIQALVALAFAISVISFPIIVLGHRA
jgi:hypothetical protein